MSSLTEEQRDPYLSRMRQAGKDTEAEVGWRACSDGAGRGRRARPNSGDYILGSSTAALDRSRRLATHTTIRGTADGHPLRTSDNGASCGLPCVLGRRHSEEAQRYSLSVHRPWVSRGWSASASVVRG